MGFHHGRERRHKLAVAGGRDLRLSLLLPAVALLCTFSAMLCYCRDLLQSAAAGVPTQTGVGFWLAVGGFLASCAGVTLLHSLRLAHRVAGPEHRLRRALQRMRGGDVGFRVALRRGDLLSGLARECNQLLDWLNHNPPAGVRKGGDIVELAGRAGRERRP